MHELVVDRLIGAGYDNGTIPDTFSGSFEEKEWKISAKTHVLIRKPAVSLDLPPGLTAQQVLLILNVHAVVVFLKPPPVNFLKQQESFKATVKVPLKLVVDKSSGALEPDFGGLKSKDITITVEKGTDLLRKAFIEVELPKWVPTFLNGVAGKFKLPVNIDAKQILSDKFDLVPIDETGSNDVDSLNFTFYSALDSASRGNPNGVVTFLEKQKTFGFLMSRAVFSVLSDQFMNKRFARFNVTIGKSDLTKESIVFSTPDSAGQVKVKGKKSNAHKGVSGTIRNATQNKQVSFSAKDDGTFEVKVPAAIGDVLEVRGNSIAFSGGGNSANLNYKPNITLQNGYMSLSGSGSTEVIGIDVDVDIDGKVGLRVDPVTGQLVSKAYDIELDIPWWADFLLGILTGPFAGLILALYEDSLEQDINRLFNQNNANLLPTFKNPQNMVVFNENITVKTSSLALSGQVEAGLIHSSGRSGTGGFTIDSSSKDNVSQSFSFYPKQRWVGTDPSWYKQFAVYGLVRLGKVDFQRLRYEDLAKQSYKNVSITIPGSGSMDGEVFAVQTAWKRYAKVRIDKTEKGEYVLRWVTYKNPLESTVKINGKWESDFKLVSGGKMIWYDVHKYWGNFSLGFTRIYTGAPLKVKWTYNGPGSFKTLTADQKKVNLAVDLDKLGLQKGFNATLTVEVEDIFGRKATDSIQLDGYGSYGEMGESTKQYLDPETLWIWSHGPGPVSLPIDPAELVKHLQVMGQLCYSAMERIQGEMKARLDTTAKGEQVREMKGVFEG